MDITITRPKRYFDMTKDYRLWVDGRVIASIGADSTQVVTVPEGSKKLKFTIDKCASPELLVSDMKSRSLVVQNSCSGNPLKALFLPFYYLTLDKDNYLKVSFATENH